MKVFASVILFFLSATFVNLSAQGLIQKYKPEEDSSSCFRKWYNAFKKRGSKEVTNGKYDEIIISFRQGVHGNCFYGKTVVKRNRVEEIYIRMVDGEYEKVEFDPNEDYNIANGISESVVAKIRRERQVINVIFYKNLNEKPTPFQKAPEPNLEVQEKN